MFFNQKFKKKRNCILTSKTDQCKRICVTKSYLLKINYKYWKESLNFNRSESKEKKHLFNIFEASENENNIIDGAVELTLSYSC